MKARGGYLTSFAATAALLYVLIEYKDRPSVIRWFTARFLTAVVYLAQPLWLPGVLPILLFFLLSDRKVSFGLVYVLGIAATILVFHMLSAATFGGSWRPPAIGNRDVLGSLPQVVEQIYVSLTGSYYLRSRIDPSPVTGMLTYFWFGIFAAAVLVQIYRVASKQYLLWSHLPFASILSTLLATWVLFDTRAARYLLPLSAPLVILAGVELFDLVDRKLLSDQRCRAALLVVLVLGAVSLIEFRDFSYMWKNPKNSLSEAKRMEVLIYYLRVKGATRAFSVNALLQWQIMFYSREEVIARWMTDVDRYPAYIKEANRALADGETIAVVGHVGATGGLENLVGNPEAIFRVDDKYFVYVGADRELLKRLNFRFVN